MARVGLARPLHIDSSFSFLHFMNLPLHEQSFTCLVVIEGFLALRGVLAEQLVGGAMGCGGCLCFL